MLYVMIYVIKYVKRRLGAMFADKKIEKAYEDAPRFDESELYGSGEYRALMERMFALEKELYENVGKKQWELFQRHMSLMYEECEFECVHYFRQGWLSAKNQV